MNVLIAGGFWAIAKFMVLLCCTIVSMIKRQSFSMISSITVKCSEVRLFRRIVL